MVRGGIVLDEEHQQRHFKEKTLVHQPNQVLPFYMNNSRLALWNRIYSNIFLNTLP